MGLRQFLPPRRAAQIAAINGDGGVETGKSAVSLAAGQEQWQADGYRDLGAQRFQHVQCRQARDGAFGQCTVEDSGPGVPEALRARIFEPFFSTREGGLGLGLSLCETLATGMGGSLALAPAGAAGACFVLRLPIAGAPAMKEPA